MADEISKHERLVHEARFNTEGGASTAVKRMGQLGSAEFIPVLEEILAGDDLWLVCDAAVALGQIGDPRAVPALAAALMSNNRWDMFDQAVEREKGAGRSPGWVLAATQEAIDITNIQIGAAAALGRIGDPSAIDGLLEAVTCTRQYQQDAREAALEALASIRSPRVVPEISNLLNGKFHLLKDSDPEILWCKKIVATLEKIGSPDAVRVVRAWKESQKSKP